jgi:ABC-type nitrate/sulfonate/bicarbonate transport system substrate-binding protein
MKKNIKLLLILIIGIILILISIIVFKNNYVTKKAGLTPIRIGYQTAWIPQAQLAQVLKHTDILEKNDLKGEFKGFNYGGPLNEAALAGEVDVLFVADFPAINLLSKSDKFSIVARLTDFRNGIIVPTESSIKSISDLKGKTLSIPFGSSPHVHTLNFIKGSGLDLKKFNIKNLDIAEQMNILQKGSAKNWEGVDAFATWDPAMAAFEENGKARILKLFNPVGTVVMSNDFITQNPAAAKKFLESFIESYFYYAKNQTKANEWFIDESKFTYPQTVIDRSASLEKNLNVNNIKEINILLNEEQITRLENLMNEAVNNGLLKQTYDIRSRINQKILGKIRNDELIFDLGQINTK